MTSSVYRFFFRKTLSAILGKCCPAFRFNKSRKSFRFHYNQVYFTKHVALRQYANPNRSTDLRKINGIVAVSPDPISIGFHRE